MRTAGNPWSDVFFDPEADQTVSYRSGLVVYEESFVKGRLVGRGWNGSGFVSFYDGRIDPASTALPQAFWLEVDGQLLASDWQWRSMEIVRGDAGRSSAAVTLEHAGRRVRVVVRTTLDGTCVLRRRLEITNTGLVPAALSACGVWSGPLQRLKRWRDRSPDRRAAGLFSLGYFDNPRWGNEGDFRWHEMPAARLSIDGRFRRDRHRHPWLVVRNNATGEHFVLQLGWSGGYSFELDLSADSSDPDASLVFRAGPDAPAPLRVLSPGETVYSPEVHLGLVFGGLDEAVNAMHEHLRASVLLPQPRGRGGWVESGIGPEVEITSERVVHAIDSAAEVGAEVFFVDASWYAPPRSNWWSTVGDWEVSRARFPDGLAPFRARARERGMLWGLWMDVERLGAESRVAKEHPEWLAAAYDGERRLGGLLDLTNADAARWMEEAIARVIEQEELDFFRLDHNVGGLGMGLQSRRGDFVENGWWRYYDALYGAYERLRARFPALILENCAGGGGRTDVGMVRLFSHTWVTDWQIAPRAFAITNGMTMALPPEIVDRLLGGQSGFTAAELDFQTRLLQFARPTLGFLKPDGAEWNPNLLARVRRMVELYKGFVRPHLHGGRIYHHTPEVPSPEPWGWGVMEMASADRRRGMCGLFRLGGPAEPEYLFRPRGLDVSGRYRVTLDNSGDTCEIEGALLAHLGLAVRLEGALTSELMLFEAI